MTLNVKQKAHLVMLYARGVLTVSGIVSLSVFIAAAMEDEGGCRSSRWSRCFR